MADLTAADLAARLGIQPESVHRYRARGDLPEPDKWVGRTPVWSTDTFEKWLAARPSNRWRRSKPPGAAA